MGLELPTPPKPAGAYVPSVRAGNLIFVAGQIPVAEGKVKFIGRVGDDLSIEDGYKAAKLCALNALSILKAELGSLDKVKRIIRLAGYVSSAEKFYDQAKVVNGASDLLVEVFGDDGKHARVALGVYSLPLNAAVEMELIVEVF